MFTCFWRISAKFCTFPPLHFLGLFYSNFLIEMTRHCTYLHYAVVMGTVSSNKNIYAPLVSVKECKKHSILIYLLCSPPPLQSRAYMGHKHVQARGGAVFRLLVAAYFLAQYICIYKHYTYRPSPGSQLLHTLPMHIYLMYSGRLMLELL